MARPRRSFGTVTPARVPCAFTRTAVTRTTLQTCACELCSLNLAPKRCPKSHQAIRQLLTSTVCRAARSILAMPRCAMLRRAALAWVTSMDIDCACASVGQLHDQDPRSALLLPRDGLAARHHHKSWSAN